MPRTPSLCLHKATGQGYVKLNGKRKYLGRYDDPATQQKYHRLVEEWLAHGRQLPPPPEEVTVVELAAQYWEHAQQHYRKPDGSPTSSLDGVKQALKPLKELYGRTPAAAFGPKALRTIQDKLARQGLTRDTVNKRVGLIRQAFKWAAARELVSATVYHSLMAVDGLRAGRSAAKENEPVGPVPQAHVDAVKPFVSRQVWALIQLQLHTGARPGEVLGLRPLDLDTGGEVWTVQLAQHKTAHKGKRRTLYLGPKAQQIIQPFMLGRPLDKPLFSPTEAEQERHRRMHEQRATPLNEGNVPGSNRVKKPQRRPGDRYTTDSYRQAVEAACDRAFPPPPDLEGEDLKAWQRDHRWTPNQLRHNAATLIRREFGLEAAALVLGHSSALLTDAVYAERDEEKVKQIVGAAG